MKEPSRVLRGDVMSSDANFDRECFQKLLASAFAVQESGINRQSLSALLELQRAMGTCDAGADGALQHVTKCAQRVANASGTAVALLEGDQLVYRAGTGSAAPYVGGHVTAILGASGGSRGEILRVENAQTDSRIEADICRQFEAQSLLMLPIYRDHKVAGVLQVLFSEAHVFQDHEVRTYRLMASLVGEGMSRNAVDKKNALVPQPRVQRAVEEITYQMIRHQGEEPAGHVPARTRYVRQLFGSAKDLAGRWAGLRQPAATAILRRVQRVSLNGVRLNLEVAAMVSVLVIAACWVAYDHRSAVHGASLRREAATTPGQLPVAAKPDQSAMVATDGTKNAKLPRSAFRRVQVGPNEIDYVSDDVTIRYFTLTPTQPRLRAGEKLVNIGDDVTMRYFASQTVAATQTRPVSRAGDPVEGASALSK